MSELEEVMKKFIAFLLGLIGFLGGLAIGFLIAALGVIDVIDGAQADPASAKTIAWGLLQLLVLAELAGYAFSFVFVTLIAGVLIEPKPRSSRRRSPMGSSAWQAEHEWNQRSRHGL